MFVEERVVEVNSSSERIKRPSVQRSNVLNQAIGEFGAFLECFLIIEIYLTKDREVDVNLR